jgi:ankyrin repeat protein
MTDRSSSSLRWQQIAPVLMTGAFFGLLALYFQTYADAQRARAEVEALHRQNATLQLTLDVLHSVVEASQQETVYGDDSSRKTRSLNTAFRWAARRGDYATAAALCDQGADPDTRDRSGGTALMEAAAANDPMKVQWLLDLGADPKVKDETGWTALSRAAVYGLQAGDFRDFVGQGDVGKRLPMLRVMTLLLDKGAPVNARNDDGATAGMLVARYAQSVPCLRLLLERGADLAAKDNYGHDALDYVRSVGDNAAEPENHEALIAFLRERTRR